jgi:hypothetical protein
LLLLANAADLDGAVAQVEFYEGDRHLTSIQEPPYRFVWKDVPSGQYRLRARATDQSGQTADSAVLAVSVREPPACSIGPLERQPGARQFLLPEGRPFFWMGDTQWPLFTGYSTEQALHILESRQALGFNVVQVMAVWPGWDEGTPPAPYLYGQPNRDGQFPFRNNDPATPNDAFWAGADRIVQAANARGIIIAWVLIAGHDYISPDSCQGGPGNMIVTAANGRAFGQYFGKRYANQPNILWVLGGDAMVCGKESVYHSIYQGIRDHDPTHLIIFHPSASHSGGSGTTIDRTWNPWGSSENLLAGWTLQTGPNLHELSDELRRAYRHQPTKPVVLFEGAYEGGEYDPAKVGPVVTPTQVRAQAWRTYLTGGFFSYGHASSWRRTATWQEDLEAPGALQMAVVRSVLGIGSWWNGCPDEQIVVAGAKSGGDAIAAAQWPGANGRQPRRSLVYLARPTAVSIDLDRFQAPEVKVSWIDPATGLAFPSGAFRAGGKRCFGTPTGWEDAVLELTAWRPGKEAETRPRSPGSTR